MLKMSLVYKGYPPNHCCCDSTLRILPDGEWVVIFMTGGKREPELANHIELCRSTDNGSTWSDPEVVLQYDDKASVLSEAYVHKGAITVFAHVHDGTFGNWQCGTICSTDNCRTWSAFSEFTPMPRRSFLRNMYVTSWGEWMLPYQTYENVADPVPPPGRDGSFKTPENGVFISSDEGESWERSGPVVPGHAWAENNVVELSDGTLVMLIRNDGKGCLYRSESVDRGRTWTETAETGIPNPGSKFRLHKLSDGRIILIHNPNSATSHPNSKTAAQCNRNPLSMWISGDDMQTWGYREDLVTFPGMLAYPDGVVSADESHVHFAFDYNRHDVIYVGAPIPDAD